MYINISILHAWMLAQNLYLSLTRQAPELRATIQKHLEHFDRVILHVLNLVIKKNELIFCVHFLLISLAFHFFCSLQIYGFVMSWKFKNQASHHSLRKIAMEHIEK